MTEIKDEKEKEAILKKIDSDKAKLKAELEAKRKSIEREEKKQQIEDLIK